MRGEVWWAELAGTAGFRPVVIVSRAKDLESRRNVTVAEITRVVRVLPCEVPLSASDGMPVDCVINTDNLHTIPRERLRQHILSLTAEQVFSLERALRYSLGLEW
jgi:mRNA interferase MazF